MTVEQIKELYNGCDQNWSAVALELAIPVAELTAKGDEYGANKVDQENLTTFRTAMLESGVPEDIVEEYLEEYAWNTLK